jgi:hypothetical protein
MKTHLAQFNTILADHIASFKAANADATVLTFDSNAWFNMVLDSPAQFGFTNTTGFVPTLNITGFRIDHVYLGSAHVLTLQGSSGSVSAFCGVHTVSHIYVYSQTPGTRPNVCIDYWPVQSKLSCAILLLRIGQIRYFDLEPYKIVSIYREQKGDFR